MHPVADGRSENVWTDKVHSHRNLYFRLWGLAQPEGETEGCLAAGTRNQP